MKNITIVDYNCGNLLSLKRGIEKVGFKCEISREANKILNSTHVILPGVGAFGSAIKLLKNYDLENIIKRYTLEMQKPLLGICLGMQLLLTKSFEFGEHRGLDIIPGEAVKIDQITKNKVKIPNIGWNEINTQEDINFNQFNKKSFYFIHSFVSVTNEKADTIAYCDYYKIKIPSIIKKNKIIGCQFHPEKSSNNGLKFLQNFCNTE